MDQSTRFWDRIAERYSKRPVADEEAYQKKLQVTREYFQPHMEVLALSILHLLENKEAAIAKVHQMLKPGGVFVTSSACVGDTMKFFKLIVPIGRFLGLMPLLKVFTTTDLKDSLTAAGFEIDYEWQPKKFAGLFIVAKKGSSQQGNHQ